MGAMPVLEDVEAPRVGQTDAANWAGPLLQAVMSADESNRELFAGTGYSQTVHQLCDRVRTLGGSHLWGASEIGNRLIGAMLLADPDLRAWTAGDPAAVVLVDGFVAGPDGVVRCASHVRSLGARQVTGLVLGFPTEQLATQLHEEIQVVGAKCSTA